MIEILTQPPNMTMALSLLLLVVLSGFFSATETAFTSLNRIRLKNKADNGDKRAALSLQLVEKYDSLLTTILIGNNIVNISASTIGTLFFTQFFFFSAAT